MQTFLSFLVFLSLVAMGVEGPVLKELRDDRFILNLKYKTQDNFLKKDLYKQFNLTGCWILEDLQKKLLSLIPKLKKEKLKLILWDCYRPLEVQKAMWKLVPDPRYVADPKVGSHHNRGAALDAALANEAGELLPFPTVFDDFSPKAHPQYQCLDNEKEKCRNRDKLIRLMESVGLVVFPTEWWHFQLPHAEKYPVIKSLEEAK